MVSLGPVQITFLIKTPFSVISSWHVPSGMVGFTYTNGSWCMVTICSRWDRELFSHRSLIGSIPRRTLRAAQREKGEKILGEIPTDPQIHTPRYSG